MVDAAIDRFGRDHVRLILRDQWDSFVSRAWGMWFSNQLDAFENYVTLANADPAELAVKLSLCECD